MPSDFKKFETARTRKFRATVLSAEDERTIRHVEEFGCSVVNVSRTNYGLGWSYTIGVFDTNPNSLQLDYQRKPRTSPSMKPRSYREPVLISRMEGIVGWSAMSNASSDLSIRNGYHN